MSPGRPSPRPARGERRPPRAGAARLRPPPPHRLRGPGLDFFSSLHTLGMRRQVEEMKRYLADYGLVWVGGPPGQRHGEGEPKVEPVRTLHPRLCARGPGSAGRRVTPPRSLRCQDFSEIEFDRLVQSIRELSREAAQYARPVVRQRAGPAFPRGEETGDGRLGEVPPPHPLFPAACCPRRRRWMWRSPANRPSSVAAKTPCASPSSQTASGCGTARFGALLHRRAPLPASRSQPRIQALCRGVHAGLCAGRPGRVLPQGVSEGLPRRRACHPYPPPAHHHRGVVRARDLPLTPIVPPPYRRR